MLIQAWFFGHELNIFINWHILKKEYLWGVYLITNYELYNNPENKKFQIKINERKKQ